MFKLNKLTWYHKLSICRRTDCAPSSVVPSKPTTRQCPELSGAKQTYKKKQYPEVIGAKQTYNETVPRVQWCQANLQQDSTPMSMVPSKPSTRQYPEVGGAKQTYNKTMPLAQWCQVNLHQDNAQSSVVPSKPTTRQCR